MNTFVKNFRARRCLAFFAALIMAFTSLPLTALATDESGVRPESGVNYGSPFVSGNPSTNYRIPNLVTMDDGTLVAQADARWDAYADGGGNDSIVAYSEDNGETWNYSMLTYYPDNGNYHDKSSTSVCDSALATDGKTLYALTTFFPAGYALNTTSADHTLTVLSGSAFNDDGTLRLSRGGSSDYDYHLGDFDADGAAGRAPILDSNNSPVDGWEVDHDFYVYNNGTKQGNLFYSDCEFQTVKTNFLLFRSSVDNGKTWSDFKLVNVKLASESFYGVGPGRGVVTDDGTIIFPCYSWTNLNSSQRSSFIYSKDGGKTWTRMDNLPTLKSWADYALSWNGTSECQPVLLDDGTIRLFCRTARRRMVYADAKMDENGNYYWVNATADDGGPIHLDFPINGENFNITENNQYSVIKYSKKVLWNGDYYTLLIGSHANGGGTSRTDGHLTFMLLDDNNEVVDAVQKQFTTGEFGYSCLTELSDGRLGVLYEYDQDGSSLKFQTFDIEETSGYYIPDSESTYNVNFTVGDSQSYFVSETSNEYDDEIISVDFQPNYTATANNGSDSSFSGAQLMLTDALYTFTQRSAHSWYISNSDMYLNIGDLPTGSSRSAVTLNSVDGGYFQLINEEGAALSFNRDGESQFTFYNTADYSSTSPDYSDTLFEIFAPVDSYEASSADDAVPGYERITDASAIQSANNYLIGCQVDGNYYFLYPSHDTDNIYTHTVRANKDYVENGYKMTMTALSAGTTSFTCGNEVFNVEVSSNAREIVGVVDYDPVIYTHGSNDDITTFGNNISDGTAEGEKVTGYKLLDDSYEIISVTAVDSTDDEIILPNSAITASDGKLTGTLSLADNNKFNSYESGTYVTLKTQLRDNSGLIWTQKDTLYVASNPVPGHIIIGNYNRRGTSVVGRGVNLATYVMAMDSYGNTTMTADQIGSTDVGNARILFPTSSNYFTFNNTLEELADLSNGSTDRKFAGAPQYSAITNTWSNQSHTLNFLDNVTDSTVSVAYYYYDKSSDDNQGIVSDSDNPDNFTISMGRMPVNSQYEADDGWSKNVVINNSSASKLSGSGTVTNNSALFGSGEYTILDSNHRKTGDIHLSTLNENGDDAVEPNTTANLKGVVQYQETANRTDGWATSINNVKLTFEVKMCDKTNERNEYENAVSSVVKSTWFTSASWDKFSDALKVYQEYLNNYTVLTTDYERTNDPEASGNNFDSYLYENGESTLSAAIGELERIADFTEYDIAKAELMNALTDEKYSVSDLQSIEDAISAMTYFSMTDDDKETVYENQQDAINVEASQINALVAGLKAVEYDDVSAAQAAVEFSKSAKDPDVYDVSESSPEFAYTSNVSVGGKTVVGFIYPSQTELDRAISDYLASIKKQVYTVYLNGASVGTAEYGESVIVSSDGYITVGVDDLDSSQYDGEKLVAWSYSYAAPSRDYVQTTPKYMITAKSVGLVVKGDTYLTYESAVSDDEGYVVKFVTDGGKVFDVQYAVGGSVTVPSAPEYPFYTFAGYEGGYNAGDEITVSKNTTIIANYEADTSRTFDIDAYSTLEAWQNNEPTSQGTYKYNERTDVTSDNAYCWVEAESVDDYGSADLTLVAYGSTYSFYVCSSYTNGSGLVALTQEEYQRIIHDGEINSKTYRLLDGSGNLIEVSYDSDNNPVYNDVVTVSAVEEVFPVYSADGTCTKFSMIGSFAVLDGYKVQEYGILFSSDISADLTIENVGTNGVARMKASAHTCGNQFAINVRMPSDGSDIEFKFCAYAIVSDSNGAIKTVYSKSVMDSVKAQ